MADHIDPPIEPIDGAVILQALIVIILCLGIFALSLYQADHLQLVLPTDFGYMLALSIVLVCFGGDAFSVDTLINSVNWRERVAPCLAFCMSAVLHLFMIQSSQLAFVQGGHIQAGDEAESSQSMRDMSYMRSSLSVMMNDTKDTEQRMEILERFDSISDRAERLEKEFKSSREKAMEDTGQSSASHALKGAIMIDLAMWIAGISLGGYRGYRRMTGAGSEPQAWHEEPEPQKEPPEKKKPILQLIQPKIMKRPKFTERLEVEIDEMMQPRRDNTPGNKRKADYALQIQHAKMNISRINNVEDIKRECKCGQSRATAIRDDLIAKGVWQGQMPRKGFKPG